MNQKCQDFMSIISIEIVYIISFKILLLSFLAGFVMNAEWQDYKLEVRRLYRLKLFISYRSKSSVFVIFIEVSYSYVISRFNIGIASIIETKIFKNFCFCYFCWGLWLNFMSRFYIGISSFISYSLKFGVFVIFIQGFVINTKCQDFKLELPR